MIFGLPHLGWIAFLGALLVTGILLMIRGVRGYRQGDEPRCEKCLYELTGLTSDRCPECGNWVSHGSVVLGVKRRRKVALACGVLIVSMSITGLSTLRYWVPRNINWAPYTPSLVLEFAADFRSREALEELIARANAVRLSNWRARILGRTALVHDFRAVSDPVNQLWMNLAAVIAKNYGFDFVNPDVLFSNMVEVDTDALSMTQADHYLSFMIREQWKGPTVRAWVFKLSLVDMNFEHFGNFHREPIKACGFCGGAMYGETGGSCGVFLDHPVVGEYQVELVFRFQVLRENSYCEQANPMHAWETYKRVNKTLVVEPSTVKE